MSDKASDIILVTICTVVLLIVAYPLYYVLIASFSDPYDVYAGKTFLLPSGFTFDGYKAVFADPKIVSGFLNSVKYTVIGTIFSVVMLYITAYPLAQKDLPGRKWISLFFVFTMYFQGGTIPFYILINNLGLMNTRFLMIIVSCITVYNIILVRSFCASSLPRDLWEAASIDGCSNIRYVFQMVFPLSKAIIAVIALYIAVSYWNSYFWPMIFLQDANKLPLQNVLREILLIANMNTQDTGTDPMAAQRLQQMASVIKYSAIVVSTVPIICVYPFIQKYFVQGVMIGSIKG